MASNLISDEREALFVDPPLTLQKGHELAVWIKSALPDKKLFITHDPGDHCCPSWNISSISMS